MKQVKSPTIVAIVPAYNAAKTLLPFFKELPQNIFDEIILVDDCSTDGTYEIAKSIPGISVYKIQRNLGYGGNVKLCLGLALEKGGDIMVELHPDREYGFDGIPPALAKVKKGAKFVLGNRFAKNPLQSGMRVWKYPFIKVLTMFDNVILGISVGDMHQGFRVYTRELLESVNYKATSNDYIFSFEIIAQTAWKKMSIASVPVTVRYKGKKRGARILSSIIYSLGTFRVLGQFLMAKWGMNLRLFAEPGKKIPCPLCKEDKLVVKEYTIGGFTLFFCTLCQNGFTYPVPKDSGAYYSPYYWEYKGLLGSIKKVFFGLFQNRRRAWIRRFITKGRVVDVGSGEGEFGKRLGERFRVINIEPPFSRVKNRAVIKVDFLSWQPREQCDAIVFWESLEHVTKPKEYLEKSFQLLRRGGVLFIECPAFSCFESKVFGRHWLHLDMPRHLFHFTPHGLSLLVGQAGFLKHDQWRCLAPEYSFFGLAASFFSCLGKEDIVTIRKGKTGYLFFSLLFGVVGICLVVEWVLFLVGESPIQVLVAQKGDGEKY